MIHLINLEPAADLAGILGTLEAAFPGAVSQPYARTPRVIKVDAPPEAHDTICTILGPDGCCCDSETPASMDAAQVLNGDQWALGHLSGDQALYEYDATGAGSRIYLADLPADTTVAEFEGRLTSIYNPYGGFGQHGTWTAGAAGGAVHGVAKGALLYSAAGFAPDGTATAATVNDALNAIADHIQDNPGPPSFVNCSFTSNGPNLGNPYLAVIDRLAALGATIVAAGGNQGIRIPDPGFFPVRVWPAEDPDAIAIGAHDKLGAKSPFSNYGTAVEFYCGGQACEVVDIGGGTLIASGTSLSAPHVCGVLACAAEAGITDYKGWLAANAGSVSAVPVGLSMAVLKPRNLLGGSFVTVPVTLTAADVVAALDVYFGNTDWRTPGGATPGVFSATQDGLVPASGGGTVNFLRADGAWITPPSGGGGGGTALPGVGVNLGADASLAMGATIPFNAVEWGDGTWFNPATSEITIPVGQGGRYIVSAGAQIIASNNGCGLQLNIGGAHWERETNSGTRVANAANVREFTEGTVIKATALISSGNATFVSGYNTFLRVQRIA